MMKEETKHNNEKVSSKGDVSKNDYKPYIFIGQDVIKKRRSQNYIDLITKLDQSCLLFDNQPIGELSKVFHSEFPEVQSYPPSNLVAIVRPCLCETSCEVFVVDFKHDVVKCYAKNMKDLPQELKRIRNLALSGYYLSLEVYEDCICAVNKNGFAAIYNLKGNKQGKEDTPEGDAHPALESASLSSKARPQGNTPANVDTQMSEENTDNDGCLSALCIFGIIMFLLFIIAVVGGGV